MEDKLIKLDVGGKIYATRRSTLTKIPDSMLARMIAAEDAGMAASIVDDAGAYVIDRDGELFRFVLNYLRDGVLSLPSGFSEVQQLRQEAEFYQLGSLVESLKDWEEMEAESREAVEAEKGHELHIVRNLTVVHIYGPTEILREWAKRFDHVSGNINLSEYGYLRMNGVRKNKLEEFLIGRNCKKIDSDVSQVLNDITSEKSKWFVPLKVVEDIKLI